MFIRKLAALSLFTFLLVNHSVSAAEIFSTNSVWRFRKGTSEASLPTSSWRDPAFNDASAGFVDAPAPFWYGDVRAGGTQLTDMQNNYTCIFLRRTFTIGNALQVNSLRLQAFVDDGFVAWINGVEVARANVTGDPTYQTLAANQSVDPAVFNTYNLPVPSGYLVSGTNELVVQVFNTSAGSSDLGFDALLDTTITESPAIAPTIVTVSPTPGTVSSLTSIAVTFSEPVTGLKSDDFLVNGNPPDSVSVNGNTYTFNFLQPLYGSVFITWDPSHGITDLATPPNAFNATGPGATWQYDLVDTIAPTVSSLYPPAGIQVGSLSQIQVTFDEPVTGIDASDLLINGQPATNMATLVGSYLFYFPPAPTGTVNVAWSLTHGITDTATPGNAFAGGNWTYTVDPNAPTGDLVITEFLAANISINGLADEDGEQQDWIEIYNRGTSAINLANYSLSDDPELPGLWVFPARILAANSYLVVFASGKDRRSTNPASPLHTNFKLGNAGEHLGLYTPDSPRFLTSGYTSYPEQRNDVSYGVDPLGIPFYYATPTPGAPNGVSTIVGVCAPVHANVKRGHFTTPFDLTLSCATPGATLRYTTDGSEPTASSAVFPGSLHISNTTLFRAAAFKANYLPAKTITDTYFFNLPASIRSLPVVSIVTASNNLYGPSGILGISGGNYNNGAWQPNGPGDYHNPSQHGIAWERETSVEWIQPEDNSGFQAECGLRVHGSDYQRPRLTPSSKFSLSLFFRGAYGEGRLDYPLFPLLTSVHRFDQIVLRAGFNEQGNPFIRDEIHRRLSHDMGGIASPGNLAVVFVNGAYYSGSPWYNPCERVGEGFFQEHLGGGDSWDVVGPTWLEGPLPGVVDGDRTDFQNLVSYVNNSAVTAQSVYTNIARWLDLTNFADYCILNGYGAMGDWPANNWRAGKDRSRSGPWRFVLWDAEWGMGIYGRSVTINSFTQTGGGPDDSGLGSVGSSEIAQLYNRLRASPEFRLLWADRIQKHFFNGGALTGANITNRFNELRDQLFPLMGNMDVSILNWARDRQPIFFGQLQPYGLTAYTNAPGFNQFGGRVAAGFSLIITNTGGTIYYTTDGSDPRTAFTGAASPSALTYSGPVTLNNTVTIRSRALTGGNWSAMAEATFTVGSLGIPLRITELMYNPPGGSLYEFIELQNTSGAALDVSAMYFDGVNFIFPEGTTVAGGARIVLGSNTDTNAWRTLYPGVNPIGWFGGNLNNSGERISIFDRFGNLITSVDYKDSGGWPTAADGGGRSLEVINPNGDPDDPANWQASAANNGTPGAANSAPPAQPVYLNEIMAENATAVNHGGTFPDWIELRNPGGGPINIIGWSLTDDGNARKFVFPSTTIAAGDYLTVWCDATTNTTPGLHTGFSLGKNGETISLYDANTNRIDALTYGLQLTNYSVGRVGISGWTLTTPTTNAANVAATLAPASNLALNEWLANPTPGNPDWVELYNKSTTLPVSLQGIYLATSNTVHQITSLSFLRPLGCVQLFADEGVGADHLDFKLSASGETLVLSDSTGSPIQSIAFGPQTEGVSQGRLPDGNSNVTNFVGSVSPGATNYVNTWTGPVINEVLARNKSITVGTQIVDFVELYNPGGSFNLGGLSLSVDSPQAGKWTFPPGTIIAANGYLLIKCDGDLPASTNAGAFNLGKSLNGESGGVYLFNTNGQPVNFVEYGLQADDLPIGLYSGQWRLLNAATPGTINGSIALLGTTAALRVNEWMPNPAKGEDWFELFNTTNRPVDLSNISLSDDPSLAGQGMFRPAPLSFIGPKGFVKWVADGNAGQGRDHVNFSLDAQGDSLLAYNVVNNTNFSLIDSLGFGTLSNGVSSGRLLDGAANILTFPGTASPGFSNYRLLPSLVINEALAHTDPPLEDAIELRNLTTSPVSINGWYLSNSRDSLKKYLITNTTPIPPGGYGVIYEYQFNNGTSNAFTLNSAHGDEIWLTATAATVETGERAGVEFGATANAVSLGRVETSQGVDFWPLTARTFGQDNPTTLAQFRTGTGLTNAAPVVGPIIINEIMYQPLGGTNGTESFLELRNNTTDAVLLYDPDATTNHWKLGGGIDFTFPANVSLAAGGYLLVVDFDPTNTAQLTAFRNQYGISVSVPVFGPYSGKLNNDGDTLELYRPDPPQLPPHPDAGFVPYVLADRVSYTDHAPWPGGGVDGGGLSLQRLAVTLYGNEPLNWIGAAPTPGADNSTTSPDTDGDGIPDAAELLMGLDPNDPADAGYDPDHDGMTNLQEYLAGTDHLDPNSYLKLDGIALGLNVTLSFQAVAGHTYSVLHASSLANPVWTKLADVPAPTENQAVILVDPQTTAAARFYRLVTPALP